MKHIILLAAGLLSGLLILGRAGAEEVPPEPYLVFMPVLVSDAGSRGYDMSRYMTGDGRLYEVQHSGGSQARHQTQFVGPRFYHTKGNEFKAEWEELWVANDVVYRGTDTSPGNDQYYTLYDTQGLAGSAWAPRYWHVGDLYERNPFVVFYRKSDCGVALSGYQRSWLRFEAFYPTYTFASGIQVENVVELTWLLSPAGQPLESYFYAENFGLVGWGSEDRGYSYVSEVHAPGARPDNKREVIPCMDQGGRLRYSPDLSFGPLPPEYRVK